MGGASGKPLGRFPIGGVILWLADRCREYEIATNLREKRVPGGCIPRSCGPTLPPPHVEFHGSTLTMVCYPMGIGERN
jgi:hypothetical protein